MTESLNAAAAPDLSEVGNAQAQKSLREIVVACGSDDHYAMPLGVTMLSAARNLGTGHRLKLYIMDGGISEENRLRLEKTWSGERIDPVWLKPDRTKVDDLTTSHHISPVAYFRILLPSLLPKDCSKVLYLDSDLLVRSDLTALWDAPLDDQWLRAVPDVACPYVDAKKGLRNFRKASPYLASLKPIRNYVDFEIDPTANYFNSGVLSINLDAWREQQLSDKMLNCLRTYRDLVWCWDQYALNAILAGHWKPLPLKWNLGTHAYEFPSVEHSPLERDEFKEALDSPNIVHFTTEFKPWDYGIEHPYRSQFFELLDQTEWSGWRPDRPPFRLIKWWDRRAVAIQKQAVISYRRIAAMGHRTAS